MTVATEFYSWQANPNGYNREAPPYESCSPLCRSYRSYTETKWGMSFLGCHVDRAIIGGSSPSTHSFGAAVDMSWRNFGRATLENEILPFFINNSKELGLQAIHDYDGQRIWRPPAYRERLGQSHTNGWKTSSGGQFVRGNKWIHLEVHPSRFLDQRSVEELIAPASKGFVVDFHMPEPLVPNGDNPQTGRHVTTIQSLLKGLVKPDLKVDSIYGIITIGAVLDFQKATGLTVDGICGPKTTDKLLNG